MNISEVKKSNIDQNQIQGSGRTSSGSGADFSQYVEISKTQDNQNLSQQNAQNGEQENQEEMLIQREEEDMNAIYVQNFQNMNNELFDMGIGSFSLNKLNDKDMFKYNLNLSDLTLNDIKLFEGLTQKNDVLVNSFDAQNQTFNMNIKGENLDVSYRSIEISKTLFSAIDNAMQTGKPVRLDFGADASVILRISKDGKISADFVPNDKAMELAIKVALPELRAKFEEENIPYGTLNYKQFNQNKDKQDNNKEKNKDEWRIYHSVEHATCYGKLDWCVSSKPYKYLHPWL